MYSCPNGLFWGDFEAGMGYSSTFLSTGRRRAPCHVRKWCEIMGCGLELMTDRWRFGIISENN